MSYDKKILNPDSKENTKSFTEKYNYNSYKTEYLAGLDDSLCNLVMRKKVGNVKENDTNFIVEFEQGSLLTQGVVFPKNLGFEPEKGMRVIYDSGSSIGSAGRVLFYDLKSESPLFVATRSSGEPNWTVDYIKEKPSEQSQYKKNTSEEIKKDKEVDIKAPESLMPASRVLYRALMEGKGSGWGKRIEEYLSNAENGFRGEAVDSWSKPLADEYKRMKEAKILGDAGQILNPQAFASSEFFKNGGCYLIGLGSQKLSDTKEFTKLSQQSSATLTNSNKERLD